MWRRRSANKKEPDAAMVEGKICVYDNGVAFRKADSDQQLHLHKFHWADKEFVMSGEDYPEFRRGRSLRDIEPMIKTNGSAAGAQMLQLRPRLMHTVSSDGQMMSPCRPFRLC